MKKDNGIVIEGDIDISGLSFQDMMIQPELPQAPPPVEKPQPINKLGAADMKNEEGQRARIGDRLVAAGMITKDQLNVALQEKKISGKMLGEVFVDLGFIKDDTLSLFLAEMSGYEIFNRNTTFIDSAALALIEKATAVKYQVLPISNAEGIVRVALADPYDVMTTDFLRRQLKGYTVKPMIATPSVLSDAIDAAYGHSSKVQDILKELETTDDKNLEVTGLSESEMFMHPIVRLVNALVSEAVKLRASDLHFEPEENFVRLRYRIDGDLMTAQTLHKQHWNPIGQRLKIMASLNIADKLSPQDGRISIEVGGKEIDFRVSTLPTVHGENIVMRVLDKNAGIKALTSLGFSEGNLKKIKRAQAKPEGIIIVTGPTGSGKTTSLYSMLNEINTEDINIQTMEDPVEYSLPMIRQTSIREGVLDFADGIRALMRQDPNVIFIGEVRDNITAGMALKAAMTGHQVYTTLHTNDSFGAMPRLYDLGMAPGMIAGNIVAVFAQRLVRTLCPHCKQPHTPSAADCEIMGLDPQNPPSIFKAKDGGCDSCAGLGFRGRIAVAEILTFDEEMDEIVAKSGTKAQLKAAALKNGFKSMRDDGILKILDGITTLEALAKVVDIHGK